MKDKTLLRISAMTAVIGIIALFILTETIELTSYTILDAKETGGDVKITGTVKSIKTTNGVTILTLKDETGEIKAVSFNSKILAKKGEDIEVEGRITEYNGEKEIEIQKARIIPD